VNLAPCSGRARSPAPLSDTLTRTWLGARE
jgi:hypothetical protein